ncbi:MAG: hypothetical protein P8X90_13510 [Desulfobacterales bacterium]|jgi:hypothetical protein
MKLRVNNFKPYQTAALLLFWLACFCGTFFPAPAAGEKSVADEIISLNVADKPLGEVLDSISEAADCRFKIDAVWEDYPITASFKDEPLYRVIKRIFRDFNNAVIYGSDRTIKIIIYDEGTPAGRKGGYSVASKPSEAAVPPAHPYGEATAPQPEVQASEESGSLENVGQASDENSESISETSPAGTEDTEAKEESGEAEPQDKNAAVEAEQNENAPGQEGRQTEPTESASDSSENPEKAESDEEPNQN